MIDWKTPILNKGQGISTGEGATILIVDHLDRTIDPYLAGVIHEGKIIYSGLHATLADARKTCERHRPSST